MYGHPGGGPLQASPFRVAGASGPSVGTSTAARTERDVLVLAADLEPGDSGSALVSRGGRVVGVAFAIAPDRPGVAYALTPAEVRAVLAPSPRRGHPPRPAPASTDERSVGHSTSMKMHVLRPHPRP